MAFGKKTQSDEAATMVKETPAAQAAHENAISIIGPGMRVVGDC